MPRGGKPRNKGGGNKRATGIKRNKGNKRATGKKGNAGGAATVGNTNSSSRDYNFQLLDSSSPVIDFLISSYWFPEIRYFSSVKPAY